jgi:hypothetical protein
MANHVSLAHHLSTAQTLDEGIGISSFVLLAVALRA